MRQGAEGAKADLITNQLETQIIEIDDVNFHGLVVNRSERVINDFDRLAGFFVNKLAGESVVIAQDADFLTGFTKTTIRGYFVFSGMREGIRSSGMNDCSVNAVVGASA